jgi:hypothetical protein
MSPALTCVLPTRTVPLQVEVFVLCDLLRNALRTQASLSHLPHNISPSIITSSDRLLQQGDKYRVQPTWSIHFNPFIYLMTLSVAQTGVDKKMITEWRIGKYVEGSYHGLIYGTTGSFCRRNWDKPRKNLSQNFWCPGRDLNPLPPEHEEGV